MLEAICIVTMLSVIVACLVEVMDMILSSEYDDDEEDKN